VIPCKTKFRSLSSAPAAQYLTELSGRVASPDARRSRVVEVAIDLAAAANGEEEAEVPSLGSAGRPTWSRRREVPLVDASAASCRRQLSRTWPFVGVASRRRQASRTLTSRHREPGPLDGVQRREVPHVDVMRRFLSTSSSPLPPVSKWPKSDRIRPDGQTLELFSLLFSKILPPVRAELFSLFFSKILPPVRALYVEFFHPCFVVILCPTGPREDAIRSLLPPAFLTRTWTPVGVQRREVPLVNVSRRPDARRSRVVEVAIDLAAAGNG
jgi:hypothetical protein